MTMTCKLCGTEIKENETVCSLCGTAVENTSVTVEEKPAPAVEETSAPVVETPAPAVEEVKPEPVAAAPAAESKFVCSGCGKEYPAGTKFCAECGGKIEEKKPVIVQKEEAPKFVCSGCGKEYPAGTKFCAECGGKVEEVKPVAPVVFACTGCGKEYPAGTKFCSECGGKVEVKSAAPVKKIVCTKCGKEYPDGGKFCAECGGKIEETIINNGNSFATANTKAAVKQDVNGLYDVVLQEVDDGEKAEVLLMLTEVMAISNQEAKKIVDTRYLFEGSVLVRENCSKEEAESLAKKIKFACFEKISIGVECNESSEKYLGRFEKHMTVEAARDMVEHGVDVNVKDNDGSTPLIKVVWRGHLDVVKYLVSQGADVNAKNNDGGTPLYRAAARGHLDVVKYLVSQGADVNAKNNDGGTPFYMAAVHGHLDVVKYLVSQGADVNAEDDDGVTPLYWAANNGFLDIVKYLVSQGADVNAEDNDGVTPLHRAARRGKLDTVKYLVSQGAEVNAKNNDGETPLDKAIEENEDEIADFLKQHGAVAHETPMTAAEIVEEYFPSSKMKFSSAQINFAPDFPMCTTPPHEDTIAIIVDDYVYTFINKSGIYIRPKTEGSGAANRFFSNLFDGARQPVDLPWQNITSLVYNHDRPGMYDDIEINNTTAWLGHDKAIAQFANDLKNYAREQGAKL